MNVQLETNCGVGLTTQSSLRNFARRDHFSLIFNLTLTLPHLAKPMLALRFKILFLSSHPRNDLYSEFV